MTFESSKTLGGVGALLLFISFIPLVSSFTYGVLPLIGLILLLIGMKGLADYYKEPGIFSNSLYATIIGVVGAVALIAVAIGVLLVQAANFIREIYPGWNGDWATLGQMNPADVNMNITFSNIAPFIATLLLMFVGLFIIVLVTALLYRKSLRHLNEKSGVGLFGTAGTIMLIGGALTIIFGLGLILIWIAILLVAIAFFQLREPSTQPPQPYQYPPQYPPPPT